MPKDGVFYVHWSPPLSRWVKLNTDGSVCHASGNASAGGVVRGEASNWCFGFAANIGSTSIFNAELWALLHGLRLCVQLHYVRVQVELDSSSIVSLFSNGSCHEGSSSTMLEECRGLLTRLHTYTIRHVYREANQVADHLASQGHSIQGTIVYSQPPTSVGHLLLADVMGTNFPRF